MNQLDTAKFGRIRDSYYSGDIQPHEVAWLIHKLAELAQLGPATASSEDIDISTLKLSVRCRGALKRNGIVTVGQMLRVSLAESLAWKNFGQSCIGEIRGEMNRLGYVWPAPEET